MDRLSTSIMVWFLFAAVVVLCGAVAPSPALASDSERSFRAVPPRIPFQGFLTDGTGVPISGTVALTLTIYDDGGPSGVALWSESQSGVSVLDGVFAVSLGDSTPLPTDLFEGTPRWLGVRVDGGAELSPRTELEAVPYAFHARNSDLLGGLSSADLTTPKVAFFAFNTADDVGVAGNWAVVEQDQLRFSYGGGYDIVNDRFVAPVSGVYCFSQQVAVNGGIDGRRFSTALYVNGGRHTETDSGYLNTGGSFQMCGGTVTLHLEANDFVESYIFVSGAHTIDGTAGETYTSLSGHLLFGTEGGVASPVNGKTSPDPQDETLR